MSSPYETEIWNRLNTYIQNDYGTAALMGNLQAESGLIPYRLQGDFTDGYTKSLEYTNNVDRGTYSRSAFINDSKGYGLAQWTYSTRKSNLYDYAPLSSRTISSLDRQIPFMLNELQNGYPSVWNALINATSIRTASDVVLVIYENPADQSESVKIQRAQLGNAIYERQHGEPPPTPPTPDPPSPTYTGLPVWLLLKMSRNRKL